MWKRFGYLSDVGQGPQVSHDVLLLRLAQIRWTYQLEKQQTLADRVEELDELSIRYVLIECHTWVKLNICV